MSELELRGIVHSGHTSIESKMIRSGVGLGRVGQRFLPRQIGHVQPTSNGLLSNTSVISCWMTQRCLLLKPVRGMCNSPSAKTDLDLQRDYEG